MTFSQQIQFIATHSAKLFMVAAAVALLIPRNVHGQNINVTTPFISSSDSYYEHFGVNFGFGFPGGRGNGSRVAGWGPQGQIFPNILFSNGGFGPPPVFGGYNPNAAARFGFSNAGPNGGYSLGLVMGKGSTRTNITNAPSLTVQNGFGGSFATGQLTPFVNGVVPVVGQGFAQTYEPDNGVTRAIQSGQLDLSHSSEPESYQSTEPLIYSNPDSSATRGDLSVAQIKAERQRKLEAQRRLVESTLARAAELEQQKNYAEARTAYRQALTETDDENLQQRIKVLIKATRSK